MRVLVAACGSRGDFQPMLALAVELKARGHDVLLAGTPSFASEAAAFGVAFSPVGGDVAALSAELAPRLTSPLRAIATLNSLLREEVRLQLAGFPPLARGRDVVIAGGAVLGARTAAEAAGAAYRYVLYTAQLLPSAHHPPFMLPLVRPPRWVNRLAWAVTRAFYERFVGGLLNDARRALGLAVARSPLDHVFDPRTSLLASDPEYAPPPPDVAVEPFGALSLPDERPLSPELERFFAAGTPPVYAGFGSMTDVAPAVTTRALVEGARRAGQRLVLSRGWANLGEGAAATDVFVTGSLSHRTLLPRTAAVIHHGGAGTTAAAARAGVPQIVVPHGFDQFVNAERVRASGLALVLPRKKLTAPAVAKALEAALGAGMRDRARTAGESIRARNAAAAIAAHLEELKSCRLMPRQLLTVEGSGRRPPLCAE